MKPISYNGAKCLCTRMCVRVFMYLMSLSALRDNEKLKPRYRKC